MYSYSPVRTPVVHLISRTRVVLAGLLVTLIMQWTPGSAWAQAPAYYYIGVLGGQGQEVSIPFGIAPGPIVYGQNDYFRNKGNFRSAYVWSPPAGIDPLPGVPASGVSSGAYAVSADGSVLVGVLGIAPGSSGGNPVVFRRVNGGPDETLPLAAGMSTPNVSAISGDGTTTVGFVNGYGGGGQPVQWAGAGTATYLSRLPGAASAQALGVNGDGSVIVGWSGQGYPGSQIPVRWVNGQIESLGLPPACNWAWATGVSADGSIVVGIGWVTGGSSRAFRWTSPAGMTLLSSGTTGFAEASSISDDGRLIGGRNGTESVVWRDGVPHGVQSELVPPGTLLAPFGGLTGNVRISHDGKVIAGSERVIEAPGDGEYHSWALVLPDSFACLPPLISNGPQSTKSCNGSATTFSLSAPAETTSTQWQWRRQSQLQWQDVVNGINTDGTGFFQATGGLSMELSISDYHEGGVGAGTSLRVEFRATLTNSCGNVTSSSATLTTTQSVSADLDHDCDVDSDDLAVLRSCNRGTGVEAVAECGMADLDHDSDVDSDDFGLLQRCYGGSNRPPAPGCTG